MSGASRSESPPRAGPRRLRVLTFQGASAPGPRATQAPPRLVPGSRGSPASGRSKGRGGAARREGASSGSVRGGRSGCRALGRERRGVPVPAEVGRGARRAARGREARPGGAQRGEAGLAEERAGCWGRKQPSPWGRGPVRDSLALPLPITLGCGKVQGRALIRDPGVKEVCGYDEAFP